MLKHVRAAMHKKQTELTELAKAMQEKQTELRELAEAADELHVQIMRADSQDRIIQAELATQSTAAMQTQQQRLLEERKRILAQRKS